jgi:uncharacterized protein (DUF952 family)/lysophospholipase L1-like esterase
VFARSWRRLEDDDAVTFHRYVALGDSQTEGLLDPDGRGGYRGWADRFAGFVALTNPSLRYANLAVRGRLIGQIHEEQVDPGLAMRPDLVTVMGGLNDLLRPSFELDEVLGHFDATLSAFGGATVLTNTFPDIAAVAPLFRRLGPRMDALNTGIREVAAARGALVVDFAAHGTGTDPRVWSPDRIHANPVGHALIAAAFAHTLGLPGYEDWAQPLPARPPVGRAVRVGTELRWVGGTVAPWMWRRARGRSSGDGISAKRPRLVPVAPLFHIVAPGEWAQAVAAGEHRPESLARENFVHFSFAHQVAATANLRLRDEPELLVIEVDATAVPSDVVVEDSYGSGTEFPHVYGPVPVSAVVAAHVLTRGQGGDWVFSRDRAAAAASPGR